MIALAGLDSKKRSFLRRYNISGTPGEAYSRAVTAASQRNVLYLPDLGQRDRRCVRLHEITRKYARNGTSDKEYERDVRELSEYMNVHFGAAFRDSPHPRYRYAPGFRISHAQKSLAVALKHLWCMGDVAMPPQCPVDSVVLGAAGARYPDTRWAYVNSVESQGGGNTARNLQLLCETCNRSKGASIG
jgi:hypothetical protein